MEPLPTSSLEAGTQTCPEGSPLSTEPLPTGLAHPQPQPLEPLPSPSWAYFLIAAPGCRPASPIISCPPSSQMHRMGAGLC